MASRNRHRRRPCFKIVRMNSDPKEMTEPVSIPPRASSLSLSVVIPARNEEGCVAATVRALAEKLEAEGYAAYVGAKA